MVNDTQIQYIPQVRFLVGKIDEESVRELSCHLSTVRKPTLLLIDSGGGCAVWGSLLAGAILYNARVTSLVTGSADSMAIPVFQSCQRRIMIPGATMLFHSGQMCPTIPNLDVFDAEKIERWMRENRESELSYEESIVRGIKPDKKRQKEQTATAETIREWRRKEYTLEADDALAFGLCDAVLPFTAIFTDAVLTSGMY